MDASAGKAFHVLDLFVAGRSFQAFARNSTLLFLGGSHVELNDLLIRNGIDPATVLVMRHCLREVKLKAVLPWLVEENHKLFNAYQQTQTPRRTAARKDPAF
jgi:hypothetical protein